MHILEPDPRSSETPDDSETLGISSQQSVFLTSSVSDYDTWSSLRSPDLNITHPHSDVLPVGSDHILPNAGDTHVHKNVTLISFLKTNIHLDSKQLKHYTDI